MKKPARKYRAKPIHERPIGAWNAVGIAAENLLNSWPKLKQPVKYSELCAIMVVAISPATLAASLANPGAAELAKVLARSYAKNPDLTIALLKVMRAEWDKPLSAEAKIKRHLGTKIWLPGESGILSRMATDVEVAEHFSPRRNAVLKDIAKAKKARQRLRFPEIVLGVTWELNSALVELHKLGFDVGNGTIPVNYCPPD